MNPTISLMRGALGLLLLAVVFGAAQAQTPEDAIIARVNGEAIFLSQLKEAALDQDVPPSALVLSGVENPAYRKALTQVVDELLLVQQAKAEGLAPNDTAIAREVDQMLEELRRQAGSQEKLDEFFKQHHLTLSALRALMTERERKRSMATEVVAKRVVVDDAAVAKFTKERQEKGLALEEVNLAQILVPCTPGERKTERGAKLRAEALKAARDAGVLKLDDLPLFVRRYEETSGGAGSGVALGWLDPAKLMPALREQVAKMIPGEVSQPVETEQGYHVLIVLGRHAARDIAFVEEFDRARTQLLTKLRRDAVIQLYDLNGRQIKLDLTETAPAQPGEKAPGAK